MKNTAIALGLGTMLALPVHAGSPAPAPAEPVVAAPTVAPAPMARDWTGFYLGGRAGYMDLGRDIGGDGWFGGLQAGYLQDFGNGFAAGGEVSYDRGNIGITLGGAEIGLGVREVLRVAGRAGVTTGDFFIFGTAGAARARVPGLGSETGPFGGVGVDYMLTDNIILGGEVLYHRFSDFAGSGLSVGATTAKARVSFRF
ncbi:MAG: outer membrane protein [Alkalilacustris sp.]